MNPEIAAEFGLVKPSAVVLDDHPGGRKMMAKALEKRGFSVEAFESVGDFTASWRPGMVDLIVADWQLSDTEHGDDVLASIRARDWDVPFVLVSGKLDEDDRRVRVLEVLLHNRAASFVARGSGGIAAVCDEGEALLARRDMTLLKVVLSLRRAASNEQVIQSSRGPVSALDQLAELVAAPESSRRALRPLAALKSGKVFRDAGS